MERVERPAAFRQTRNSDIPGRTEKSKESHKFGNIKQYRDEAPKEIATFESKDLENNDFRDGANIIFGENACDGITGSGRTWGS